jgi:PncC family amidohydrolase
MLPAELTEPAAAIAQRLKSRGQTLAVAESAAGGLISAALLTVAGASAYYRGGLVIYTLEGANELLAGVRPPAAGTRGASEPFARWLADSAAAKLDADWGIGETGASGPTGNPYGDPAGHAWVAVHGPDGRTEARNLLTGSAERERNMELFAAAGLALLLENLS